MTRDSKESALSRWSRRKLETQQALEAETKPVTAAEIEPELPADVTAEQPVLTDVDMPPVESLTADSDFSQFMSPGVSDDLRNLALRKLFRAPVFNIRDGLDEYDDDFTQFEKLGDIVTSDMKHQIEMQQKKLREKLAAEGEDQADDELEVAVDDEDDVEADIDDEATYTVAAADSAAKPDNE